jgi:hypothetical protein
MPMFNGRKHPLAQRAPTHGMKQRKPNFGKPEFEQFDLNWIQHENGALALTRNINGELAS